MNKAKLLDEMDKNNRDFWKQMELCEALYQKKKAAADLWAGARCQLEKLRLKQLDFRREYDNN